MPQWDEETVHFMRYWFAGLADGLDRIDPAARSTILHACGKACAQSYTAGVFQDAWNNSDGLPSFLEALSGKFPGATYTFIDPETIRVRYAACDCDLVCLGLVRSPLFCECSVQNLKSNFEAALGTPVAVTLESSLLSGQPATGGASGREELVDACSFLVSIYPKSR